MTPRVTAVGNVTANAPVQRWLHAETNGTILEQPSKNNPSLASIRKHGTDGVGGNKDCK